MRNSTSRPKVAPKVAVLVNILAPYRLPIYRRLGEIFDTTIYLSNEENNRDTWKNMESFLVSEGIRVKRSWGVTLSGQKGKGYDFWFLHFNPGYLIDLCRDRPDAVITIEMGFRTLMALLYGSLFRKPVWVWWGGTLLTERSRGKIRRVLRWLIARWAKRWISYGYTSTEYLVSLGIPRERILQIQNCVDESLYTRPTQPAFNLNPKPVLLYVGQMIGRKGVRLLLEAAARLQKEGWSFTLLLVGSGPEKESLEAYARELGLDNVYFQPAQPPEKMPAIYRSADCLVFPTLEDVWGLVVNEAMWSGIPVLVSIYAGCAPEIVPPEQCFDPLNPIDFDRALRLALTGKLSPPDTSRLKTCRQVADMIIDDIRRKVMKR